MIYFLQNETTFEIKIGYTGNDTPDVRSSALQTGNPSRLILLGTCKGDKRFEGELHARFVKYKVRGEWYRPGPRLLLFIISRAAITYTASVVGKVVDAVQKDRDYEDAVDGKLNDAEEIIHYIQSDWETVLAKDPILSDAIVRFLLNERKVV